MTHHDAYLSGLDLGIEHDLGALELELAGMEHALVHGIGYGDLGGAGGAAAGATGGAGAAAGGLTLAAATTAGPLTLAALGPVGWGVLAAGATGGAVVGGAASWRASVRNVARLKAKIKKLKTQLRSKLKSTRSAGRKRRLKRRYARRIKRAEKRIARILRVMKRRIKRRRAKGKDLTARQKRMRAALGMGRKRKPRGGLTRRLMMAKRRAALRGGAPSEFAPEGLPEITSAEDAGLTSAGEDDLLDIADDAALADEPIYKQPWFLAIAGTVVIGGILLTTRKSK